MRTAQAKPTRAKLSTTVSLQTIQFLESKVASGEAISLAEAVDSAILQLRRLENRHKLAAATERYFNQLDRQAAKEEDALARDLGRRSER